MWKINFADRLTSIHKICGRHIVDRKNILKIKNIFWKNIFADAKIFFQKIFLIFKIFFSTCENACRWSHIAIIKHVQATTKNFLLRVLKPKSQKYAVFPRKTAYFWLFDFKTFDEKNFSARLSIFADAKISVGRIKFFS